jgi:hypothetical protein
MAAVNYWTVVGGLMLPLLNTTIDSDVRNVIYNWIVLRDLLLLLVFFQETNR